MQYIQLTAIRYIRRRGTQGTFRPGDWLEVGVDIGKQTALQWIAEGAAHMPQSPNQLTLELLSEEGDSVARPLGVVIRGGNFKEARKHIPTEHLEVVSGGLELPFERTLLWSPEAPLRSELLPVGFYRLERGWQIAVPLLSYQTLASTVGSSEDRARTEKVTHDLRIMLYDTRLLYIKKCPDTEKLIKLWKQEPGDERLAFLRALFAVKPIICALPQNWVADRR